MTRGDFEKELEQYISHRRRAKIKFPNVFKSFKSSKKKMHDTEMPPEITTYDKATPAEPFEAIPGDDDYPAKKGFMTKILETLGLVTVEKKGAEIAPEEVQKILAKDEVSQDTKEVAKIALAAIKQLPPEQLAIFKAGPEFARLKELLRKHQLIK
jgi:hypothetical protein